MREQRLRRIYHVCAGIFAWALALFLLFETVPCARAAADGMIRVKLSRLGAPAAITMQADCDYYLASHPSARISAGTEITVSASGGKLTLSAGKRTVVLGETLTLMRSQSGSCGVHFSSPALSNRFCGDLAFSASGNVISTVLNIYVEDYLCGVVGCVMAPSSGFEALKAQAIAARNSALRQKAARDGSAYDVLDTDAALTFKGISSASEYAAVIRAVDATRGSVLYYGDSPAVCYYTDSNGGQIESAANALGTPLAYSAVADDPYDFDSAAVKKTAVIRKDGMDLQPALRSALIAGTLSQMAKLGVSAGEDDIRLNAIERVTACDSRYAAPSRVYKSLTFQLNVTARAAGGATKTGSVSVSVPTYGGFESWYGLGINDENNETVWVTETGSAFEVTFRRSGHGVGMSQRGAQSMAREGFSCADILGYYYPGTAIKQLSLTDTTRDAAPGTDDARQSVEPIGAARLNDRASLYEHANAASTALTVLPAGATVDVYAVQDAWAAVGSGGRYGFVLADKLSAIDENDPGEVVTAAGDQYARLTESAGLYVNADDAVSPKEMLARDSYVKLIAYNRSWACVRTPSGSQGYVKREFLAAVQGKPDADAGADAVDGGKVTVVKGRKYLYVQQDALKLYRTYSTDSQVLATLVLGERVRVGAYNSKWACVRVGDVTGFALVSGLTAQAPDVAEDDGIDGGAIRKVAGRQYAVVTRNGAPMYESWHSGAAKIAVFAEGERVQVGAYNSRWACVRAEGVTGYMAVEDLELAAPDEAGDSGVNYVECEAVTTADVQLFGSANLEGAALAELEQGTPVHVYAYNDDAAYVKADGKFGFVALRWLRKLS